MAAWKGAADLATAGALVVLAIAGPSAPAEERRGAGAAEARADDAPIVHAPPHADRALLVDAPDELASVEARGYALGRVLGAVGESGDALSRAPLYADVVRTLAADVAEMTRDDRPEGPRRAFDVGWLGDARTHFDLVGVVNRLDRRVFGPIDPRATSPGCGEVRLVYRLALAPAGRPTTRLPMTLNVVLPQPEVDGGCAAVAARWSAIGAAGAAEPGERAAAAVAARLAELPPAARIEVDFQSIHVPSTRADMDDAAEYVLRVFAIDRDRDRDRDHDHDHAAPPRARVATLLDTPRDDLDGAARVDLARWIGEHLAEVDAGTAVIPDRFLATRAVSASPRGLAGLKNRPFARLFPDADAAFGALPLASTALVTTPKLLVRRLDEMTCAGCHQSRAVAGFHLLGDERDRDGATRFNALAVGASPHLVDDLAWRRTALDFVAHAARGEQYAAPRPFPEHPAGTGAGAWGAACGVDPEMATWRCAAGLTCRDVFHDDVGLCVPDGAPRAGDACQSSRATPSARPEGDVVHADPLGACAPTAPAGPRAAGAAGPDADEPPTFCASTALGFPAGLCSERCTTLGERIGASVCAPIPAAGYEAKCFFSREPIEACLRRQLVTARVRWCDRASPCRDGYACARVPGLSADEGACVPPYFVFQARVDGPVLDR